MKTMYWSIKISCHTKLSQQQNLYWMRWIIEKNKISSFTGNNEGPDDFSECLTILERCNSHLRCYFSPSFVCYFRESSFMNPFPSTKHLFHLWKCKLIIRIIRKEMKPTSQIIFRRKKLCWRAKTTLVKRPKSNKKVI